MMMRLLMGLSSLFEMLKREREETVLNVSCLLAQIQDPPFSPLPPPVAVSSVSSTSNRAYTPLVSANWASPAWNSRLAGEWREDTYPPGFSLWSCSKLAMYLDQRSLLSREPALYDSLLADSVRLPILILQAYGGNRSALPVPGFCVLHTWPHTVIKPSPSIRIGMCHLFLVQYRWEPTTEKMNEELLIVIVT